MDKHCIFIGWKTQYCAGSNIPQMIYKFNAILVKIPKVLFSITNRKTGPLIHIELQRILTSPNNIEKEETLPDFRIKTVCYYIKHKHTDQWNRIESPEYTQTSMANVC